MVSRLGEELITDSTQALLELIKNSYDADASTVSVDIDTTIGLGLDGEELTGRLRVSDTGHGMDAAAISDGWLTLSASPKVAMKAAGRKTTRGRTPLGDKGLGRLGVQRIGDVVRLRSRPTHPPGQVPAKGTSSSPSVEHRVEFRFSDFSGGVMLDAVRVTWTERDLKAEGDDPADPWPLRTPHGTVVEVVGLREPEAWQELGRISNELSKVINPFQGVSRLAISVRIDGQPIDLARVGRDVRKAALSTWHVRFDGQRLEVAGSIRPEHFQPRDPKARALLGELLLRDGGRGLVAAMQAFKALSPYSPEPADHPQLVAFRRTLDLEMVGPPDEFREQPHWWAANPCGPFELEIDTVTLTFSVMRTAGLAVFDNQARYRDWIKERAGVEVYRDGFRVAKGADLLDLASGFTSGGSFYSLRPGNVLGYVSISAEKNGQLEETTDREGFRDTPATRVFFAVLRLARDQINKILDESGRATNSYIDAENAKRKGTDASLEDLADRTKSALQRSAAVSRTVGTAQETLSAAAKNQELAAADPQLAARLGNAAGALARASDDLEQLAVLPPLVEALQRDHGALRQQLDETYQLIGLGLVAEALAHELTHTVQRLADRSSAARNVIKTLGVRDAELDLFVEEVDSAARALRIQLRHLDPQLRYAMTQRREVDLAELVRDAVEFHRERLRGEPFRLSVKANEPRTVRIAPGRLMQVIDNLVLNAEYWVRQDLRKDKIEIGTISLAVSGATFSITDNGPGVAPDQVASLFEPFASSKANGRGLGLFICRQLLAAEDATIELKPSKHDRPRTFFVDLSAQVVDR